MRPEQIRRTSDMQVAVRQRMEFARLSRNHTGHERRAPTRSNAFWRTHGFKVGLVLMALSAGAVIAVVLRLL